MALSDEILATPARLATVRAHVEKITSELGAPAGFLVDEKGTPFATVGHVEFTFPNPLSALPEGDAVLEALLGEAGSKLASPYVVERVGARALLTIVMSAPLPREKLAEARRRLSRSAADLARLF